MFDLGVISVLYIEQIRKEYSGFSKERRRLGLREVSFGEYLKAREFSSVFYLYKDRPWTIKNKIAYAINFLSALTFKG